MQNDLEQALSSPDSEVRLDAVYLAKERGGQEILERLTDLLSDPSPTVRKAVSCVLIPNQQDYLTKLILKTLDSTVWEHREAAAIALKGCDNQVALNRLCQILADQYPGVSLAASHSLQGTKNLMILEKLCELLTSELFSLRNVAAIALRDCRNKQILNKISDILSTHSDKQIREMAATALAGVDYFIARKALIAAVNDSSIRVRLAAIRSLAGVREAEVVKVLSQQLNDKNAAIRSNAARSLTASRWPEIEEQLVVLLNLDQHPEVRKEAALALISCKNEKIIGRLISALDDSCPEVRNAILTILRNRDQFQIEDKLMRFAKEDTDPNVRRSALLNLKNSNHHDIPSLAIYCATRDKNETVRSAAVELLAQQKSNFSYQWILNLLADKHLKDSAEIVRKACLDSLLKGPELDDYLGRVIREDSCPTLKEIAFIKAQEFKVDSLEYLIRLGIEDQDYRVRLSALNCINENQSTNLVSLIIRVAQNDDNWKVKKKALLLLKNSESLEAHQVLVHSLLDPNPTLRITAAQALQGTPHQSILQSLHEKLLNCRQNHDKIFIARALQGVREDSIIQSLCQVLESADRQMQILAAVALEGTNSESGRTSLKKLLYSKDSVLRAQGYQSLSSRRQFKTKSDPRPISPIPEN